MVARRRNAAIAREDHPVPRSQGQRPSGPHSRAWTFRHEGPHADRGYARLGPLGACDPVDARARAQKYRPDHGLHRARRSGHAGTEADRVMTATVLEMPRPVEEPQERSTAFVELE